MSLVIDSHVHLYPRSVSDDPGAWAVARKEPNWAALVLPQKGRRSLQGWADAGELIRDMDRAGIDRAVLQGWYWECQATCDWHNRFHRDCVRAHPDRLSAFATVQPSAGGEALEAIRRAAEEGFLGLGELCPAAQGGSLRDPHWAEAIGLAAELGLLVHFHADEMVGRPHAGRVSTPPADFQWILEENPDLRIILAHLGGGMVFHRLNRGARKFMDRIWFDLAAVPLLYGPGIHAALMGFEAGRHLLFASDYPLITHPGLTDGPDLERVLGEVRGAGLPEPELERILGGNAAELFGL